MVMLALLAGLLMPPAQYDHEPTRPYAAHYVAPDLMSMRCRGLDLMVAQLAHPNVRAIGCTNLGTMDVWIDNSLSPDLTAKVVRHEKAHVNGWRH